MADEIRALLKQRHRSDSPRQIEGTWQYIRRHLAADTEVTSPDRLKVLGSTLEALGSRQCSPATATLPHRSRINTEFSPKTAGPYKRFGGRNQGPAETKVSPSRQNY